MGNTFLAAIWQVDCTGSTVDNRKRRAEGDKAVERKLVDSNGNASDFLADTYPEAMKLPGNRIFQTTIHNSLDIGFA